MPDYHHRCGTDVTVVGRPRSSVNIDDIMALRALNYKWTKIAKLLSISHATLYSRLTEADISPKDHSQLSAAELDQVIISVKVNHPNDGEVLMQGHLLRQGIKVTRKKLRQAIHRVDHESTVARQSKVFNGGSILLLVQTQCGTSTPTTS